MFSHPHHEYSGFNADKMGNHNFLVEVVQLGKIERSYYQLGTLLDKLATKEETEACATSANRQLDRPALFESHSSTKRKLLKLFWGKYHRDLRFRDKELIPLYT